MAIPAKTIITSATEIHIGDKTHNHDHVIIFSSLRVIKTIVSNPVNPIPLELDELLLLLDIACHPYGIFCYIAVQSPYRLLQ